MPLSAPPSSASSSAAVASSPTASSSSSCSASTLGRCSVRVILLNREELQISIENKNIKVADLFSRTCEHVGLKETDYFGFAQKKDGEFQFLQLDTKLQKLASKLWKSKNILNSDKPQLTFYLRVMHYVNNIGLLRNRTTRHQYYLQLRENLLSYGQTVSEEKCFILASYALQADFGPYNPEQHVGAYFDPREYFPAWVVMRRGQDYITTNLPVMHKDLAAMTQGDARVAFIREVSCPPICHNFHFYRLRRRKYDSTATIWLAIGPRGLEIHEEVKEFKNLLSVFYWQNIEKLHHDKKKFEIVTDSVAERKFTYYVTGKEWGEHLLVLCRTSHHFQMTLQPRLLEMQHHEAQDQRFQEMYVHGENAGLRDSYQEGHSRWQLPEHRLSSSASSSVTSQSLASGGAGLSTVPENAVTKTPNAKGDDVEEIMIVSPPLMSSTLTTISPMSDLPQSSLWSHPGDLQTPSGRNSGRSFRRMPSSGHQGALRGAGSFIAKHNLNSSSKPNSSVESLMAYTLSNSNSPSVGRTPASLSPSPASSPIKHHGARDDATKSWMASSSVNSTPSWRSASPNSSTGSGQLLFSLPPKQTLVDAAALRKSLPHGTTLNEYISRIFSGEETQFVTSGYQRPHRRKSSLDEDQPSLSFATTGDLISRSTSLRQPHEMRPKTDLQKGSATTSAGVGGAHPSLETRTTSLLPVQSLPQMPVPAQVQRIVFPEKMTAVSTSVRRPPQGGRAFGEPLHAAVGSQSILASYSPAEESPGSVVVQPMHSTPIPSRYRMQQQQAHVASIPYGTPLRYESVAASVSSGSTGFDQTLAVPSYAFPAMPVITSAEVDYRGKLLTSSMLDYTRSVAPGLSVFGGQIPRATQPLFFTSSSQTPVVAPQDPLPRSDPPAYHEWQAAAQAMAELQRQHTAAVADQTDRYTYDIGKNHGVGEDTTAVHSFLSLSSYLNPAPPPLPSSSPPHHSISEFNGANRRSSVAKREDEIDELDDPLPERNFKSASTSMNQNLQLPATKPFTDVAGDQLNASDEARTNIREKLRNFGPSDLPMIKALLTDKSLLNYQSQPSTTDPILQTQQSHHRTKASAAAVPRPVSWHLEHQHLRRNGELTTLSYADAPATDAHVKPKSNGDIFRMNGHAGTVLSEGNFKGEQQQINGLRQHSSDVVRAPSGNGVVNHNQSHSDSVTLSPRNPVANKC